MAAFDINFLAPYEGRNVFVKTRLKCIYTEYRDFLLFVLTSVCYRVEICLMQSPPQQNTQKEMLV